MIFCRLAYGYIPSEYAAFAFERKSPFERKEYVSDLDISVFGYTVNDIVEIQKILDKAKMVKKFLFLSEKRRTFDFIDRTGLLLKASCAHRIFVKKKTFFLQRQGC